MARNTSRLTALGVSRLDKKGRYCDGGGLYLQVSGTGRKCWVFRYMLRGRIRDMGLGPYPVVTLADARDKALACRRMRIAGVDPIEARRKDSEDARLLATRAISFDQCAAGYLEAHKAAWRNEKHTQQWLGPIQAYASPFIGRLPVQAVDASLVLKVLQPIWQAKSVTASRLRGRIEQILDWAKTRGYREGENPARWRGHLSNLLPAPKRLREVKHHSALPYRQIASFMEGLRQRNEATAKVLEFLILTATRTSETLGARWDEINLDDAIWTIPSSRIKAHRQHRIPLSNPALKILADMKNVRHDGFVFPSHRAGRALSNMALLALLHRMERLDITTHGFRSTFRDWAAEETDAPREVAEAALAHAIGDKVEAAYRRGDLFLKRRKLMDDWATYCETKVGPAQILEFPCKAILI